MFASLRGLECSSIIHKGGKKSRQLISYPAANSDNQPYIYGYIPIIVAKAGMLLKSRALHTQGIFRVSGSTKRINQLQAIFDTDASGYGKNLDWGEKGGLEGGGYTVHDAASVLRRYLNMMPVCPYSS